MAEQPTNSELLVHITYIREDIAGVVTRLEKQNGRVDKAESRLDVLETKASEAKQAGAKWGGIVGGVIGGVVFVWQLFSGGK